MLVSKSKFVQAKEPPRAQIFTQFFQKLEQNCERTVFTQTLILNSHVIMNFRQTVFLLVKIFLLPVIKF